MNGLAIVQCYNPQISPVIRHPEVAAKRPSKDVGPGRRPSRLVASRRAPQNDGNDTDV